MINELNPPPPSERQLTLYKYARDLYFGICIQAMVFALAGLATAIIFYTFKHDLLRTGEIIFIGWLPSFVGFWMFLIIRDRLPKFAMPIALRMEWHDFQILNYDGNRYNIRVHFHFDEWRTEQTFIEQLFATTKEALFIAARKKKDDLRADEAKEIIKSAIDQTVNEQKILVMKINVSDISLPVEKIESSRAVGGIEF